VLPFDNISPDPSDAYFADGLTEEITASLAGSRDLRVTSRTSATVLKRAGKDTQAFDAEPREEPGFPASVVQNQLGDDRPRMVERPWRPGEVLESLIEAGMVVEAFREFPTPFWDQFPKWPPEPRERLPSSYAVLARRGYERREGPEEGWRLRPEPPAGPVA